jgi:GT2 family glycosyltransferase
MNVVAFDAGNAPGDLETPPFGPNMAFRREAFERYGLFRTDLGPAAGRYLPGQDTEFGRRLLAAGERLAWAPDAVVRHELQPDKMRRRYVASWYFGYGRMTMRTAASTPATDNWFGVPRYLFRSFALCVGRSVTGGTPARRVRHMAEACRHAGAIAESFAIGRRGDRA